MRDGRGTAPHDPGASRCTTTAHHRRRAFHDGFYGLPRSSGKAPGVASLTLWVQTCPGPSLLHVPHRLHCPAHRALKGNTPTFRAGRAAHVGAAAGRDSPFPSPPSPAMGNRCVCTTVYSEAQEGVQSKSQREKIFSDMSQAPFTVADRRGMKCSAGPVCCSL